MKTDVNVDEIIKGERRKVFYALYTLPWIISVLCLGAMVLYYNSKINDLLKNKEDVDIVQIATNEIPVTSVKKEIRTESIDNATYEFQVNAVSNGYAEWSFNVRGERSFKWKNQQEPKPSTESMHVMSNIMPTREFPFTSKDMELAHNLNINVEDKLTKITLTCVDMNFIEKYNKEDKELKAKLKEDLARSIKEFFDGFETYNKAMRK